MTLMRLGFATTALVLLVARAALAQPACFDVAVFAGRGVGDGGPGAQAILIQPRNVAVDAAGNVIIADSGNARVRRFDVATGTVTTIVGNGGFGAPTDGVQSLASALEVPSGVAFDASGNLYIADELGHVVLQLTTDGVLHRFAGTGVATGSIDGDGVGDASDNLNDNFDAKIATLNHPLRVAVDGTGNVFIADSENHRVRMVDKATGKITTVAGNGTAAPGTAGPATASSLVRPVGLAFGGAGELYISDNGAAADGPTPGSGHQVWNLTGGTLALVAGVPVTGAPGPAPAIGTAPIAAVGAPLSSPGDLAVDGSGRIYIGDTGNNVIRRVTSGQIETVVGDGTADFRDGPAILTRFRHPEVALSADGGALVIADTDNNRIRRYDLAADATTTLVGGANDPGDGGPAPSAFLQRPTGLAVDGGGNVFVSEHDSHRVRMIDPGNTISTVVNADGLNGPPVAGQPAIGESLQQPTGLGFTSGGNLLIVDAVANQVYLVDAGGHGNLAFFAGTGAACPIAFSGPPDPCGDGGPAPQATLNTALRVATAADGTVYIADFGDHRIRRVDPSGVISTFAGRGFAGSGGDGGAAGDARVNNPSGVALDGAGNLYIADFGNHKVRKVDTSGIISTVAGTGAAGSLGDGGAAGAAQLNKPTSLALAGDGSLLVVDQGNNELRRIGLDANGAISGTSPITAIVGDGTAGFRDGPGPVAHLLGPTDVAVLSDGRVLIADRGNQRVRVATPGTDCPSQGPCSSAADCDDSDPCTLDACDAGACSHTTLPADQCQPSCADGSGICIGGGGGPARTDCLAKPFVQGVAQARATIRCQDDTACDFDTTPGHCTFRLAWCFNEPGCSASGLTRLTAQGPAAGTILQAAGKLATSTRTGNTVAFSSPLTGTDECTELMAVSVALRKHGRKPGKMTLKTTALGTSRRMRDPDRIRLVCLP